MMPCLHVLTREARHPEYPPVLAGSVHLQGCGSDGCVLLNQGYGVLYAKAAIRENDTLEPRGVRNPRVLAEADGYVILAELTDEAGMPILPDQLVLWRTRDFVSFDEQALVSRGAWAEAYEAAGNRIELDEAMWTAVQNRWTPPKSTHVTLPAPEGNPEAFFQRTATVRYSDGSTAAKAVRWREEDARAVVAGQTRVLHGTLEPVSPVFPLAVGYADPVLFRWEGSWYFLATNDNTNDIGLFLRRADTLDGLWTDRAEESCILAPDAEKRFVQTFWAPELHLIGGEAYILFAVSAEAWGPQCHMMRLKRGCDPLRPDSWETPVRVQRPDGSPLCTDGITLDMTWVRSTRKSYAVWSYRRHIGTSEDTGSMLMIAEADESAPWRLRSEPVLLSRPLYGWENVCGTINNEGPYALCHDGSIYLGYSGGDACGYFYALGYLVADADADLTDIAAWHKFPSPMLASTFVPGIQGPGHHSFFQTEDGQWMIAYHAQEREKHFCRCSTYHRVHFAADGLPRLNVTGAYDLAPSLSQLQIDISDRKG